MSPSWGQHVRPRGDWGQGASRPLVAWPANARGAHSRVSSKALLAADHNAHQTGQLICWPPRRASRGNHTGLPTEPPSLGPGRCAVRRFYTIATVLALVFSILTLAIDTAEAQSLRLRLWATPQGTSMIGEYPNNIELERAGRQGYLDSLAPGNIVWDSVLYGFEYRTRPRGRFLFSAAFDTGSMANLIDGEGGFGMSPGTNRFFSANVHYILPLSGLQATFPGAQATVFAGYGYGGLEVDLGGGTRKLDARGLRFGLDLNLPFGSEGQWYLFGSAAFGNWSVSHSAFGIQDPPDGTAAVSDFTVALGRWFTPMVAGEIGWRSINWSTTAVGSTPCPCTMYWGGWTATVHFKLP